MNDKSPEKAVEVGRRMAVGAIWMVALRAVRRVVGVLSTIILARLLLPEDFGVVAIAATTIALFEFMSKMSLDLALISKQDVDRDYYDTAWTLGLIRGAMIAAIVVGLAAPTAIFFEEPRLENVFYVLAVAIMTDAFVNVRIVDFFKDFNLGKNFQMNVTSALVTFATKVGFALIWHSYWALVAGFIADSLVRLILSYWLIPYKPRLCLVHWRWVFNFSKWLMVGNFCEFLNNQLDKFIVGKFTSPAVLGLYSASFETANLPTTNLVLPIQGALFPGYAKIADDREKLRSSYLDSMAFIFLFTIPAGLGIAVSAASVVRVMLGENWLDAIPLLEILAIYGIIRLMSANTRPIYLAVKRPDIVSYMAILQLVIQAPCLMIGVLHNGAVGAAWGLVAAAFLSGSISVYVVHRLLGLGATQLITAIWRTIIASMALVAAVEVVKPLLPGIETFTQALQQLGGITATGAVAYSVVHFALWFAAGRPNGAEHHLLRAIEERFPRFARLGLLGSPKAARSESESGE